MVSAFFKLGCTGKLSLYKINACSLSCYYFPFQRLLTVFHQRQRRAWVLPSLDSEHLRSIPVHLCCHPCCSVETLGLRLWSHCILLQLLIDSRHPFIPWWQIKLIQSPWAISRFLQILNYFIFGELSEVFNIFWHQTTVFHEFTSYLVTFSPCISQCVYSKVTQCVMRYWRQHNTISPNSLL